MTELKLYFFVQSTCESSVIPFPAAPNDMILIILELFEFKPWGRPMCLHIQRIEYQQFFEVQKVYLKQKTNHLLSNIDVW